LIANSFADFAMSIGDHLCWDAIIKTAAIVTDTLILDTAKIVQAILSARDAKRPGGAPIACGQWALL
jgi:hypothetical protein